MPPLSPSYIGEKRTTLAETYGIKASCCLENLWGTHLEPNGNTLGTWKEHRRNVLGTKERWKNNPLSHPHIRKKIKSNHFYCMIHLTHCLHVFFVSKIVGSRLSPGLIAEAEIERGKKQKINPSPPPLPPGGCMFNLPVGCMKSLAGVN
jgi:hypothetical protein